MVGIVTKHDFVKTLVSSPKIENVGEIMSTPPIKVASDSDLIEALSIMKKMT